MKIVRFKVQGKESYGLADGDRIIDAGGELKHRFADVHQVIAADAIDDLKNANGPAYEFSEISFLPPVRNSNAILVVGRNYGTAFAQMDTDFPGYPSIFQRRHSAQVGHLQNIVRPKASPNFDNEAELCVIIGKPGRHIAEADAYDHIMGYSIFNEASITDWMDHTSRNVTPGKNFEASGAFGPWIATADEIGDPENLTITHRLNGEEIQNGSTADMIFSIPKIIAYLSTFTTLEPGDVISTGSPGGIRPRRERGEFLRPGDEVEMEIEPIGTLRNVVTDEV